MVPLRRGLKENFNNMHKDNTLYPICERLSDFQEHMIKCEVINYSYIHGTILEQKCIAEVYETFLIMRY